MEAKQCKGKAFSVASLILVACPILVIAVEKIETKISEQFLKGTNK